MGNWKIIGVLFLCVTVIAIIFLLFFKVKPPDVTPLSTRLRTSGGTILAPNGSPIILNGYNENFNVGGISNSLPTDPIDMIAQGANVVRIRFGFLNNSSSECSAPYSPVLSNFDFYDPSASSTGYINQSLWAVFNTQVHDAISAQQKTQKPFWIIITMVGGKCPNYFTDPTYTRLMNAAWTWVAKQYATTPDIGAYELLAEPQAGFTQSTLQNLQLSLIKSIRSIDPITPIMVGPTPTYNVRYITKSYLGAISNIIYTVDMYELGSYVNQALQGMKPPYAGYPGVFKDRPFLNPSPCTYPGEGQSPMKYMVTLNGVFLSNLMTCLTNFRTTNNVPVWVNQFGVFNIQPGSVPWTSDLTADLKAAGIGGAKWVYRQGYTASASYSYGNGNAVFWQDATLAWHRNDAMYNVISNFLQAVK